MHTDEKEAKHNTDMRNLRELTMFFSLEAI